MGHDVDFDFQSSAPWLWGLTKAWTKREARVKVNERQNTVSKLLILLDSMGLTETRPPAFAFGRHQSLKAETR